MLAGFCSFRKALEVDLPSSLSQLFPSCPHLCPLPSSKSAMANQVFPHCIIRPPSSTFMNSFYSIGSTRIIQDILPVLRSVDSRLNSICYFHPLMPGTVTYSQVPVICSDLWEAVILLIIQHI